MKISKKKNSNNNAIEINDNEQIDKKILEATNNMAQDENSNMDNVVQLEGDIVSISYSGSIEELNDERRGHYLNPIYECDLCKKIFDEKEIVFKALERKENNLNTYYLCPKCASLNLDKIVK